MSLYLLKISGSNEVENIFEWNGSGSLTAPSGYVFELYTSASVTSYSSSTALELFGGSFAGLFTGELSGSILLNGKTFDEVVNETKYGSLVLLSYSGSDIGLVSSSNGFIVSGSNIKMSLNNLENDKQYNYITTLSGSLSGSLTDSLLRFTKHAGSDKLEYFINSVEISSSGTSSYANLQVTELYNSIRDSHSTYSASVDIFEDVYYSQWFVDFDLYNRPIVGKVYSRKEIHEFKVSQEWTCPDWAKKITVVCIGGGGGGGGGATFNQGLELAYKGSVQTPYVAIGGGGGAGGNVKFKTFINNPGNEQLPTKEYNTEEPRVYTIQVGAGGYGGINSSKNLEEDKYLWKLFLGSYSPYFRECWYFAHTCTNIYSGLPGETGGSSVFAPKGTNILGYDILSPVIGTGGMGGHYGYSVHKGQSDFYFNGVPSYVPGGLTTVLPDANTLSGGPGGWGVSLLDETSYLTQDEYTGVNYYEGMHKFDKLAQSMLYGNQVRKHHAPSLPWNCKNCPDRNPTLDLDMTSNEAIDYNPADLQLPYGYVNWSGGTADTSHENEYPWKIVWKNYKGSNIIPSDYAPTGGGGGLGYFTNTFLNDFWKEDPTPYQQIGKGGINLKPIDFYGITFGEGGNGGSFITNNQLSVTVPESGSFPGGGGGGGASHTVAYTEISSSHLYDNYLSTFLGAQYGGDGGDGAVYIILEG